MSVRILGASNHIAVLPYLCRKVPRYAMLQFATVRALVSKVPVEQNFTAVEDFDKAIRIGRYKVLVH